ncbi:UMOD [Bugula neritina]|uniref:UMOD n=1 Tax=Bugula neritina TaxID=10212 RepID=A0A7J7KA49_BUGNE|nr:UMOD [Bugula neritina]
MKIIVVILLLMVLSLRFSSGEAASLSYDLFNNDDSLRLTFELFEERVKLLQKILAVNCTTEQLHRIKRDIIPGHGESQLFVEKLLYQKLIRRLSECRQKSASTTMPMSTSTRMSTPISTSTSTVTSTSTSTVTPTSTVTVESTTTSKPFPLECQTARNLTESWRADNKGMRLRPNNTVICDTGTMIANGRPWFRFAGKAGNKLLDTCPPPDSCGSHSGIWSNATMPSEVGVATQVRAYGSWIDGCYQHQIYIKVMRCSTPSQHDFIYQYAGEDVCHYSFCGMKVE